MYPLLAALPLAGSASMTAPVEDGVRPLTVRWAGLKQPPTCTPCWTGHTCQGRTSCRSGTPAPSTKKAAQTAIKRSVERSPGSRGGCNTWGFWEGVDDDPVLEQAGCGAVSTVWAALQAGEFLTDAAAVAQIHRHRGLAWLREAGGVRPRRGRDLQGCYLGFGEREEIALGLARGESMRQVAARLGRNVSTISREVARNRDGQGRYRASIAHAWAYQRASRPKPAKLWVNVALRWRVEQDLGKKYSPEQIAGRLRADFHDQPEMWVGVDRDDLPVAVCAVSGRLET